MMKSMSLEDCQLPPDMNPTVANTQLLPDTNAAAVNIPGYQLLPDMTLDSLSKDFPQIFGEDAQLPSLGNIDSDNCGLDDLLQF